MGRGAGSLLWPARNHDQFRETDVRGGSVPAAVDVLDVEADMLKGSVEGWFVPEAESSGFSSSRAILKTCGSARGGRTELLAFFDFPAEHWIHLRTTNPIESTFSTVRLRTKVTRGAGSRAAALAMVFKLVESARQR